MLSRAVSQIRQADEVWHCGPYPSEEARDEVVNGYLWMVRASDDPERESRESRRARLGDMASTEVMESRRGDVAAKVAAVFAHLADGRSSDRNPRRRRPRRVPRPRLSSRRSRIGVHPPPSRHRPAAGGASCGGEGLCRWGAGAPAVV